MGQAHIAHRIMNCLADDMHYYKFVEIHKKSEKQFPSFHHSYTTMLSKF